VANHARLFTVNKRGGFAPGPTARQLPGVGGAKRNAPEGQD